MPTMYAKVDFSIEFIDEKKNPQKSVEAGFLCLMPASVIHVGRGDVSFRLESDALVTGNTSLKYKGDFPDGKTYVLECAGVYKCSIKAAYIEQFLDNSISGELGTISLNDPDSGDLIHLLPGKPIKGVSINAESGLNIELVASKTKPKA